VDVARILEVLDRSGYGGWYVLEQDIMVASEPPEGGGPVDDIRKSLHFLETTLEGSRKTGQR
jgi:inosose dehydratase